LMNQDARSYPPNSSHGDRPEADVSGDGFFSTRIPGNAAAICSQAILVFTREKILRNLWYCSSAALCLTCVFEGNLSIFFVAFLSKLLRRRGNEIPIAIEIRSFSFRDVCSAFSYRFYFRHLDAYFGGRNGASSGIGRIAAYLSNDKDTFLVRA
jgi:hypothetical protein